MSTVIARMVSLGAALAPLVGGAKTPARKGFLTADPMTVDEAEAHVNRGGNLGVVLGLSRLIALDAEDVAATVAITAGGFTPTVIPAKAQFKGILKPDLPDPDSGKPNRKLGGSHTWLRVPDDIDAQALGSAGKAMQVRLPGGGLIDVLAGGHYVVAPPSQLELAYGMAYQPVAGGPLDITLDAMPDIPEAPRWLFDPTVPGCPPELAPLNGCLAPQEQRDKSELDARSIELTDAVDAIGWDAWLAGDHQLQPWTEADACGCPIYHFAGAEHGKSATLHDGCAEYGDGAHIWSGTMMRQLNIGEHVSRLQLSAALRGITEREAAALVGIELGAEREELVGLDPAELLADAETAEASGDHARAARLRASAANMQSSMPTPQQRGIITGDGATVVGVSAPVIGATALAPAPVIGTVPLSGDPGDPVRHLTVVPPIINFGSTATVGEAAPAETTVGEAAPAAATAETRHSAAMERAAALLDQADAPELLDEIFCTDLLREIRRRADSAMVSPMVALGANLTATALCIPWDVRLPRVVTKRRAPLNLLTIAVDESGGGKNGLTAVDVEPYPHGAYGLTDAISERISVPEPENVGSGEAISTLFAHMETETDEVPDGNGGMRKEKYSVPVMHATTGWLAWDEVTQVTTVRDRKGSTLEAEIIKTVNGEALGSKTKTNECMVRRDSYRAAVSIAAQLVTAALLLQNEFVGILQRMLFLSAVFRIAAEAATPEALAAGRRTADGKFFEEPDDGEVLIAVELPRWWQNARGDKLIRITAEVAAIFEKHRAEHGRGIKVHPWDRHMLLIQLKVATAGMAMHGPQANFDVATVDIQWWNWAGKIMEHHRLVRSAVVELRDTAMVVAAKIAGDADAERSAAKEARQWANARESVLRYAKRCGGGEFTARQFAKNSSGFPKANAAELCMALVDDGDLIGREGAASNGVRTVFYSRPA